MKAMQKFRGGRSPIMARAHTMVAKARESCHRALSRAKDRMGNATHAIADASIIAAGSFALGAIDGRFGRDKADAPEPIKIVGMPLPAAVGAGFHAVGFVGDFLGWKFSRHLHSLGNAGTATYMATMGRGDGSAWYEASKK